MALNSSNVILLTRENTSVRRSALKPATTSQLIFRPARSAARPAAATASIHAQQRTIYAKSDCRTPLFKMSFMIVGSSRSHTVAAATSSIASAMRLRYGFR
jgi:hypothetical protein